MSVEKNNPKKIKQFCLQLLARREHSFDELLHKSLARGYEKEQTVLVLQELAKEGWQNDRRYAEIYCRQRMAKGYGPVRINYELHQRGIDDFQLDAVMEDMGKDWMKVIEQTYRKKYSSLSSISRKEWAKRARFLQQRGFTFDMIQALLRRLAIRLN